MLTAMLAAFVGGIILNFMPCVFPVISLKALGILRHQGDTRSARTEGLGFLLGVIFTMLVLAGVLLALRAGGMAVGWGFQLQSPLVIAALALVILGAALNLLGVFEVGLSLQRAGEISVGRGAFTRSALTGALAIVVATPCSAPFMAGAVGYALVQTPAVSLGIFLALALGFAAPFTLISLFPAIAERLPRPGAWMDILKRGLAFPMLGAFAWLVWVLTQQAGTTALAAMLASAVVVSFAAWLYGMAQRRRFTGQPYKALLAVTLVLFIAAIWQDAQAMSDATADERLTAGMQVFLECLTKSGSKVEKLDKNLIDHHIAELDYQISRQLDAVMHHEDFQAVESLWRGVKSLVDKTDFRQNVKVELLDMSKEDLRQDFEDSPEIIQSGLYKQTYIDEYDTPGGEPIAALISAYEFDASAQDVALLRNISKVSAAAHMPFIGSAGPKFFLKDTMEDVAAIKDIGNYFDRAEYIKWKSFRETDDSRYIGLVMPRVLGRLPYGPDTVPVRSFNYVEEVKGPDHDKYLWTNASFAFASNMVRSFINNGWCVQIRGPQAGGAVQDLPIHLYDLGTGNQVKIPSEVMIPETREFEFANLGFIPLSYYRNRDYACFFSANSTQKPALYDTADATANSRINARLPYIFLLSRIAHYLKLIQRENIGTTKDRRLLELELNTWVRGLVTEMTDPGDELQASHPLRDAKVVVEDIEDNPGFFRVKLFAIPHFQVEGMDVNLSLVSQMPKAKS
ncbi:type VI secretion system contractile sheath large subunit [Pantoea sp. LS15]|nr:type VI secretion system contractile sheath large subunit [Pantoea sp. LS15]NKF48643.1 type VI secretion system contractile sheath large subunit [Pantoea sp. LS15]RDK12713.1 type VI secretion system contractile sheath large subunit [Enterobacter sp. 9-2]